jgi:16S rRNA (adenine1518-N6/adenine1519-N6)-dimethyltransferase
MSLDLTDLTTIKKLLTYYNLAANKKLGQHFLTSREAVTVAIKAANLSNKDFVVEIGPGFGTLTLPLADTAGRVLAIETDPKMLSILRPMVNPLANVEVLSANILTLRSEDIFAKAREWHKIHGQKPSYKVVSNLPYYITSAIIKMFLENSPRPERLVLMVQKEVGERITAKPGEMSVLAVSVQFYGKAEMIFDVPRTNFWPKPEVDSAIIRITPYSKSPFPVDDERLFFRIVKAGFGEKRKQLHNSLAGGLQLDPESIGVALQAAEIDPTTRPQDLSVENWVRLYQEFKLRLK